MSKSKSYADRLKDMKESIQKNKDLLKEKFPDDVTVTGSPDLIREKDKPKPADCAEDDDDEEARSKRPQ